MGGKRVVDPASTVSSRIALLPPNVCHVWHTRRGGEHAAACVCERLRAPVPAHASLAAPQARTHASLI